MMRMGANPRLAQRLLMTRPTYISAIRARAFFLCVFIAAGLAPLASAQLGLVNFQFQDSEGPADATIIVPVQIVSLTGASTVFFRLEVDELELMLVDVLPGASTISAGKEVSVGVDMMNRPTILVTDFGGGTDIIQNGDLVFLVMRSASGLSIGTDITVSGSDASAATPSGDMLTTAVFGANVEIVTCTTPSRPSFLAASDGTVVDRVALGWLPVAGASEYQIYRHTANSFASAQLLATVEDTQFDDFTAMAATLSMGGCQGQPLPQLEAYFYWVVAANVCGESAPSPVDSGFRGLAVASANPRETPLHASGTPFIWLAIAAAYAVNRRRQPRA